MEYKTMKARQIWANLASGDLERTTKFYTALGFKARHSGSSQPMELTSVTFGENDFVVNFFPRDALRKNTTVKLRTWKMAMNSS